MTYFARKFSISTLSNSCDLCLALHDAPCVRWVLLDVSLIRCFTMLIFSRWPFHTASSRRTLQRGPLHISLTSYAAKPNRSISCFWFVVDFPFLVVHHLRFSFLVSGRNGHDPAFQLVCFVHSLCFFLLLGPCLENHTWGIFSNGNTEVFVEHYRIPRKVSA